MTLIEFDTALRADAVLQKKLHSLPNVTVVTNAQTLEATGDGEKINGLVYQDRASSEQHRVELEGIFVQIGLLPNTDWLKGTVALSPARRNRSRCARPDLAARRFRRRRLHDGAVQADHHRHGRRCQGFARRFRSPDSQLGAGLNDLNDQEKPRRAAGAAQSSAARRFALVGQRASVVAVHQHALPRQVDPHQAILPVLVTR